jgi:flavin-dependent dehydrogenase
VLLLDRATFPRPKACAEYTSPQAFGVLRRLGAWDGVHAAGARPQRGVVVHGPNGARWHLEHQLRGRPHPNLVLPRDAVDAALLAHARARGAEVREGTPVRRVTRADGELVLHAVRGEAIPSVIRARLVVGADGVRSVVARDLALSGTPLWPARLGLMVRYAYADCPHEWAELHLGRGAYAGCTPLGDGRVTVTLVAPLGPGPRRHGSLDGYVEALLSGFPSLRRRLAGASRLGRARGVGPLGHRARAAFAPNALLVGDAAGFFDPLTGDGIYLALRGAELAAAVADSALRSGDCSAARLAEYEQRRHAAFGPKARLARLVQVFAWWPALAEYTLRRLERRPASAEPLCAALGDYGPPARALSPPNLVALLRP